MIHLSGQTIRLFYYYFDNQLTDLSNTTILNVSIFCFLYSSVTVNCISLTCGQNKKFEDAILGFGKHRWTFFPIY